jgi:26S proteasome regulatory subunit N1
MRRQLAFLLARAHIPLEWIQPQTADDDPEDLPDELIECLSNTQLSMHFREYGKELGVMEPKSLEDIYKSHLENVRESLLSLIHATLFNY